MSGMSELLGMIHEINKNDCPFVLPPRQKTIRLPQFNVRNATAIEVALNLNATAITMIQIPIYNRENVKVW